MLDRDRKIRLSHRRSIGSISHCKISKSLRTTSIILLSNTTQPLRILLAWAISGVHGPPLAGPYTPKLVLSSMRVVRTFGTRLPNRRTTSAHQSPGPIPCTSSDQPLIKIFKTAEHAQNKVQATHKGQKDGERAPWRIAGGREDVRCIRYLHWSVIS